MTGKIASKRRSLTGDDRAGGTSVDREILDSRYANGEIGTEDYSARLQALQDH